MSQAGATNMHIAPKRNITVAIFEREVLHRLLLRKAKGLRKSWKNKAFIKTVSTPNTEGRAGVLR